MRGGVLLAVDQGTTNTKALLIDREGRTVFSTSAPMSLSSPQPGFVEQDPLALRDAVVSVLRRCAAYARESGWRVEGIAICNQRETALAWRAGSDAPLGPAVGWQCRRSAAICERESLRQAPIPQTTGLQLDPLVSAGKWTWMLENLPAVAEAARDGSLRLGTVDTWILSCLTSGTVHATDTTNASRTCLLRLETLAWDAELLELFGIPAAALPQVRASSGMFGVCSSVAELAGVPIVAMIGDSHGALVGHGHYAPGTVKATYGTGSSLMMLMPTLKAEASTLARAVAWTLPASTLSAGSQFALEGNIPMTGAAVQWAADFLRLPGGAGEAAALAATVQSASPVYFVPAMVGMGAPYWDTEARGLLCGLGREHTGAHLARAAVDSVAFQIADVLFAMVGAGGEARALLADGGASRNCALMQLQADLLGIPVLRAKREELSALGAAMLGGVTLGWWPDLAAAASVPGMIESRGERYEPTWTKARRDESYHGWKMAVQRTRLTDVGAP